MSYFENRNINQIFYDSFKIPAFITKYLGDNKEYQILDYGCGQGQFLKALHRAGFHRLTGADVFTPPWVSDERTIEFHNLNFSKDELFSMKNEFDVIILSHVLEHIEKKSIVPLLEDLRPLLRINGVLIIQVQNAQALSGAYWAYEDFTHTTLFTGGSLYYVLRAAGFQDVLFEDIDSSLGQPFLKGIIRKLSYKFFKIKTKILFKLTDNYYHAPSPVIFSYEIKAICKK